MARASRLGTPTRTRQEKLKSGDTSDVANDHYRRHKEDAALMRDRNECLPVSQNHATGFWLAGRLGFRDRVFNHLRDDGEQCTYPQARKTRRSDWPQK